MLEHVIFPALHSRSDIRKYLFVGCEGYTASYPAMFADRDFVTIDVDPAKAKYGAARHIVDTVTNIGAHFKPGALDALVLNGVIGWGLDQPAEIDQAARECFDCLRPEGILIVGFDDMPPWRPPTLDELGGFRLFKPLTIDPFPGPSYPTLGPIRHVFNFYERPATGSGRGLSRADPASAIDGGQALPRPPLGA